MATPALPDHDPPGRGPGVKNRARATATQYGAPVRPGGARRPVSRVPAPDAGVGLADPCGAYPSGGSPAASPPGNITRRECRRSGSIVGEDHYLVREGLRQLIDAEPDIEAVAYCDDLAVARSGHRRGERPTSSSPTSACRRSDRTRASASPRGRARRIPNSASSCSASTPTPSTRSVSSKEVRPGARTC